MKKDKFTQEIFKLVKALNKIQEHAEKLGVFTGSRELLKCEKCKLMEDVTFEGILITYKEPGKDIPLSLPDSGYRFKSTPNPNIFLCPLCNISVELTDEEID